MAATVSIKFNAATMYSTEGIILKKIDIGEADAMFSIYTKDFGKIRAVAQGVKKEPAKLKGHLEKMNLSEISFVEGKSGFRLTSAEVKNLFLDLRSSLIFLKSAFYCLEFYDRLVLEGEKDLKLWDLLNQSLVLLDENRDLTPDKLPNFFNFFENEFVKISGYGEGEKLGIVSLVRDLNTKVIARPFV